MTPKQWKLLFYRIALWGGIALGCLFALLLGTATWSIYFKEEAARQAHLDEAKRLSDLSTRQQNLSAQIDSLNTQAGVEAEIREKYPLAKSGEEVIVLTNSPASKSASSGSQSLWQGLLSWLGW